MIKPEIILIKSEDTQEISYEVKLGVIAKVKYSKESYYKDKSRYDFDIDKQIIKNIIDETIDKLKEMLDLKEIEDLLQEIVTDYSIYQVRPDITEKANKLLKKYRNNKIEIPIKIIEKS